MRPWYREPVVKGVAVMLVVSGLGVAARVGVYLRKERDAKTVEQLPAVGAAGELTQDAAMCKVDTRGGWAASFAWPCGGDRTTIEAGARVQVMKTGLARGDGMCRYWVQSGAHAGFAGDRPCASLRDSSR